MLISPRCLNVPNVVGATAILTQEIPLNTTIAPTAVQRWTGMGMDEIWKPIPEYGGYKYEVSNLGNVRNLKGHILKPSLIHQAELVPMCVRNGGVCYEMFPCRERKDNG